MMSRVFLGLAMIIAATQSFAGELSGTASYRERIALPREATFMAILYDISNNDQVEIGRFEGPGDAGPPYAFTISFADDTVTEAGRYALKTQVMWQDRHYMAAGTILEDYPVRTPDINLVMVRPGVAPSDEAAERGDMLIAGMMTYMADAAILVECKSGATFTIAMEGDYPALEKAYLSDRAAPGEPLYVILEGGHALRPAMEGPDREMVIVDRFIRTRPEVTCERQMADASLQNTYWRLDMLEGVAFPSDLATREPHLMLETADGSSYRATVGCNRMRGAYTLNGEQVSFSPAASTMMACPEPLDALERQFGLALSETSDFLIEGETLILSDADGEPRAILTAVYF
ncbi:META domain-containing protein [uncultured Roseovarius sp.]|uniref:META domain-containing protein n=1 Tax=uncultured Roseovarius sp. TaxID=293344 RepID=UPI00261704DF|nr:META domain-containing protein [uncultured Roseovarius sp.]